MTEALKTAFIPRILLVEDSAFIRKVIPFVINVHPCHLSMAESGEAALKITDVQTFDIILMDIGLEDTDGFAVTQVIRANSLLNKHTPIFALTAHDDINFHQQALDAGMNGYFVKPLSKENMEAIFKLLQNEIG